MEVAKACASAPTVEDSASGRLQRPPARRYSGRTPHTGRTSPSWPCRVRGRRTCSGGRVRPCGV
nr:MAG TPA: hypothetical protein [Caudoviricetes sp.]